MDVEGSPLLGAGQEVPPLHVQIPGAHRLGTQPVKQGHLGPRGDAHWRTKEKNARVTQESLRDGLKRGFDTVGNSQSAFLRDCFFLEGLEMTLILLLRKSPMLALFPYSIFTDSMKCLRLSESLMYSVFAVQKCCRAGQRLSFQLLLPSVTWEQVKVALAQWQNW